MSDTQVSAVQTLAAWLARAAVRAWPNETRHWGLALEAELIDIEGPGASLRWALGGVMLLTRAWWRHLLQSWNRPVGVPAGGELEALARNAPRVPRTPRFVTAILLLASLGFFTLQDSRQGMKEGIHAWRNDDGTETEATIARLRIEAKVSHDPQLLALFALASWRDNDERIRAANEAVRLDPSLTWIYSKIRLREEPCCMLHPLDELGIAALQKWDPQNALPRLLAADIIFERAEKAWADGGQHGSYVDMESFVEHDPEWLAALDFAFRAPKYESYTAASLVLYRDVTARYGIREPEFALQVMFSAGNWGADRQAHIYDGWLLKQGDAANRAGKLEEAAALYWKPVLFEQHVLDQDRSDWGKIALVYVQKDSFGKLVPLLTKMGRRDEAAIVQYQLQAAQAGAEAQAHTRRMNWYDEGWAGLMLRFMASATLLMGAAVLFCMGFLFIRCNTETKSRGRGFAIASWAIDYCPLLLVIASAGLYVVYRPLALMYEKAMVAPWQASTLEDLRVAVLAPYEAPDGYVQFSQHYLNPYHYWMVAIAGLSMLAFYILFRGTLRRRKVGS